MVFVKICQTKMDQTNSAQFQIISCGLVWFGHGFINCLALASYHQSSYQTLFQYHTSKQKNKTQHDTEDMIKRP